MYNIGDTLVCKKKLKFNSGVNSSHFGVFKLHQKYLIEDIKTIYNKQIIFIKCDNEHSCWFHTTNNIHAYHGHVYNIGIYFDCVKHIRKQKLNKLYET